VVRITEIEDLDLDYIYLNEKYNHDLIFVDYDKIYFATNNFLSIVGSLGCIIKVEITGILGYSSTYDLFVDSKYDTYKMENNVMIKCKPKYDYWRDMDIPNMIQTIIDTIIDLDLFPLDLINDVYISIIFNYCRQVHYNITFLTV